jgi:hypothetical protein
MSDQTTDNSEEMQGAPNELTMLKQRAKLMGLTFSNNIGVDALREKIAAKLSGEQAEQGDTDEDEIVDEVQEEGLGMTATVTMPAPSGAPVEQAPLAQPSARPAAAPARKMTKAERDQEIRVKLHRECMKLIRCRITNLNPMKKDLPGEIFVVGNKYLGTVKKFIPFGEATDDGYHIPKILYDELVARKFQQINVKKDKRTNTNIINTRWVREFAIEVLPPLTKEELERLAKAQMAAGSVDSSADNSL